MEAFGVLGSLMPFNSLRGSMPFKVLEVFDFVEVFGVLEFNEVSKPITSLTSWESLGSWRFWGSWGVPWNLLGVIWDCFGRLFWLS